ncbi:TRAP transporter small permease subunit [Nitrogeniibacter aestuarii]|uniref:TRAP transporter small permease subunit n=1 Tax=Nitrogeniibacter aestuarii TaxID=2815343 RepID=UPI001D12D421|nr:TRAP transporter small permease subunit [Nitrogeniibacter aestuarii]
MIDWVTDHVGRYAIWLLLGAVVISAGNAISRYAFSASSNAMLEVQWYLYSAVFILGAGYTLLKNQHVRIDLVSNRISAKARNWVDVIGLAVFLIPVAVMIAWMSWPGVVDSYQMGEMSSNAGGLIRWPVRLLIPVGFWLLALQGFSELIKRLAFLTGHGPDSLEKEQEQHGIDLPHEGEAK